MRSKGEVGPTHGRRRVPLGRTARRLGFERGIRLWAWAFAMPSLAAMGWICHLHGLDWSTAAVLFACALLLWALVVSFFMERVTRPLQTLSNIVAALREEDFSFRARGAMRGDSLGDLALEINTLAREMQARRNSAMDALSLADRVISSMPSPVLAFDSEGRLRLMNAAAEQALQLSAWQAAGCTAEEVGIDDLLHAADNSVIAPQRSTGLQGGFATRWSVSRSTFRLRGVPHTLLVMSDVSAALRSEERSAWQRLIRVLSHEINNSLTPIKSVAGTLRHRPYRLSPEAHTSQDLFDLQRGLALIEERADSLHRFLDAYGRLSRLPAPEMRLVSLHEVVERSVLLERRVAVAIKSSPQVALLADSDQLQQLLINLLKNAAEAATDPDLHGDEPQVDVGWRVEAAAVILHITDNGPGLGNPANLFVPFYTTKPDGSGIGLTLCQQIAAQHQGSLELSDRKDARGCTVELVLPLPAK